MAEAISINTQRSVTLETANRILAATVAKAKEGNTPVCIAVVDGAGHLVAFSRMNGGGRASVDAAIGKARSCAGFETPLIEFSRMAGKEPWVGDLPGLIPLGGAVPLKTAGEIVGAIGVSGSTEDGEQALAEFAAQTLADWG